MISNLDDVKKIIQEHFSKINNILAVDTEAAGFAAACYVYDIPLLIFKSCSYEVGNNHQLLSRVRVGVEQAPEIGQLLNLLFQDFNRTY